MKTSLLNRILLIVAAVFFAQLLIRGIVQYANSPVEGSDAYYYNQISQEHPEWSDDMVEDYLFLNPDSFSIKYPDAE